VVSDHGSDVWAGISRFCGNQDKPRPIVQTYDITHGLAALLKKVLQPDPDWDEFVKQCNQTRAQMQQTAGSFLRPPGWRSKSRFMNLTSHMKWARQMLMALQGTDRKKLAKHLQKPEEEALGFLQEKAGWLRNYQGKVRTWSCYLTAVKTALRQVKNKGLSRKSWRAIQQELKPVAQAGQSEKEFAQCVVRFVRQEGEKIPAGAVYLGTSDVLESLFGKYKMVVQKTPCGEITANVLVIPLLVTHLTADLLKTALETVRKLDVDLWLAQNLGPSPQTMKREILFAAANSLPPDSFLA
jgi:hypothetical protein